MTDLPNLQDALDPLSSVLTLLRPRSYMFRAIDVAGAWSLQFPGIDGLRCYALLSGACWLRLDDGSAPIRLQAGDCLLMTRPQSFRMASDLALPPQDPVPLLQAQRWGGVLQLNGGGDVYGLGGFFAFDNEHAGQLLAPLPAVLHLHRREDRDALRWSIERIMAELRAPGPGSALMARQLAMSVLVLALRQHLTQGDTGVGWLHGLTDPSIARVLQAIHGEPGRSWTLDSLARDAGMSRAALALRFRQLVGEPPIAYLTRWRMLLASDRLLNTDAGVAEIAYGLGYESDSAFSAAFKRVMGCSPRAYLHSRGRPAGSARSLENRGEPVREGA